MNLREAIATGEPFRLPEWDDGYKILWGHDGFYNVRNRETFRITAMEFKRDDWEIAKPKPKTKTMYQVVVTYDDGQPVIAYTLYESFEHAQEMFSDAKHIQLLPSIEVEVVE